MNELLDHLYTYAIEHIKIDDPEYRKNALYAERHLDKLKTLLSAEQLNHLNALLDAEQEIDQLQNKTLFQIALTMGIHLGSLNCA